MALEYAQVPPVVAVTSATQATIGSCRGSLWINLCIRSIGSIVVIQPLLDVTTHVIESNLIRSLHCHRMSAPSVVVGSRIV